MITLPQSDIAVIARRRSRRGNPEPRLLDRHAASRLAMTAPSRRVHQPDHEPLQRAAGLMHQDPQTPPEPVFDPLEFLIRHPRTCSTCSAGLRKARMARDKHDRHGHDVQKVSWPWHPLPYVTAVHALTPLVDPRDEREDDEKRGTRTTPTRRHGRTRYGHPRLASLVGPRDEREDDEKRGTRTRTTPNTPSLPYSLLLVTAIHALRHSLVLATSARMTRQCRAGLPWLSRQVQAASSASFFFCRSMPSRMSWKASSGSPQRLTSTHLPFSRSL